MKITAGEIKEFNLMPQTTAEEVKQNIALLMDTEKGSVPLARELGVSWNSLDRPLPFAANDFTIDATEAVQDFEQRAEIKEVDCIVDPKNGSLKARMEVEVTDE